jgi:hypothetical protein
MTAGDSGGGQDWTMAATGRQARLNEESTISRRSSGQSDKLPFLALTYDAFCRQAAFSASNDLNAFLSLVLLVQV